MQMSAQALEIENLNPSTLAQESIVTANGSGAWGASTFHNLTGGARASGNVRSAHSLLPAADLDWDPEFAPLFVGSNEVSAEIGRAVVRSDNKQPIGIVGARYAIVPHRKLADLADALCGASDTELRYGNAGHKRGGARPFIQLKTAARSIGRDVRGCEVEVSDVITLMTGHDGTLQVMACYGANVIVCDNTYAHALSAAKSRGVSIRHTASGAEMLNEAIRIATATRELGGSFDNAALRLLGTKFDDISMHKLAHAVITGDGSRAEAARGKLLDAWTSSPGAAPGTAWGAAQAVTYYTTHEIATVGETDRSFNLATGEGRGSEIQATAWWHLTTDQGAEALQRVQTVRVVRS
jgi:phage/plasmid-like protein (TIGR03299 family)